MKDILNKNTWDRPHAKLGWGSLVFALIAAITFFAAFGGTAWWVIWYSRPDGPIVVTKMSFGLFRMCIRDDCVIDVTNRRLMNNFAPPELLVPILTILPISQWLMCFDVVFVIILFFVYLAFLAGENTYFAEVWLQLIICALIVISVAVFGSHFNVGEGYSLPFGWSYWIGVVSAILFFINSILMAFISTATRHKAAISDVALIRKHQEMESVA
jgi:hypothetical protein